MFGIGVGALCAPSKGRYMAQLAGMLTLCFPLLMRMVLLKWMMAAGTLLILKLESDNGVVVMNGDW